MLLNSFHDRAGNNAVRVSRSQASHFAKQVAGDFNPIHDTDARRFCVPGDLLFGLVLNHYGLASSMQFRFDSMLAADTELILPPDETSTLTLRDHSGQSYLTVERSGPTIRDPSVIEDFIREYVAFSGYNFPHYLQPLMEREGVMFNPQRPFVIYDYMAFELDHADIEQPNVSLSDSSLTVDGRRGDANLAFAIHDRGDRIGIGSKRLIISGLQPYDADRMDRVIEAFHERRAAHLGAASSG
jgi:hypothetical protein